MFHNLDAPRVHVVGWDSAGLNFLKVLSTLTKTSSISDEKAFKPSRHIARKRGNVYSNLSAVIFYKCSDGKTSPVSYHIIFFQEMKSSLFAHKMKRSILEYRRCCKGLHKSIFEIGDESPLRPYHHQNIRLEQCVHSEVIFKEAFLSNIFSKGSYCYWKTSIVVQ